MTASCCSPYSFHTILWFPTGAGRGRSVGEAQHLLSLRAGHRGAEVHANIRVAAAHEASTGSAGVFQRPSSCHESRTL